MVRGAAVILRCEARGSWASRHPEGARSESAEPRRTAALLTTAGSAPSYQHISSSASGTFRCNATKGGGKIPPGVSGRTHHAGCNCLPRSGSVLERTIEAYQSTPTLPWRGRVDAGRRRRGGVIEHETAAPTDRGFPPGHGTQTAQASHRGRDEALAAPAPLAGGRQPFPATGSDRTLCRRFRLHGCAGGDRGRRLPARRAARSCE